MLEGGVERLLLTGSEILDVDTMPRMAQLDEQTLQELKDRHTTLDCERLECQFGRGGDGSGPMGDADQLGSRLMWLLGTGAVHLRDRQGDTTTEINAARLSFDRPAALISIFRHEHVEARGYYPRLSPPDAGTYPYPGQPSHLSATPATFRTDAPTLGEHNESLLCDVLGLSAQEYESLIEEGVICDSPPS